MLEPSVGAFYLDKRQKNAQRSSSGTEAVSLKCRESRHLLEVVAAADESWWLTVSFRIFFSAPDRLVFPTSA